MYVGLPFNHILVYGGGGEGEGRRLIVGGLSGSRRALIIRLRHIAVSDRDPIQRGSHCSGRSFFYSKTNRPSAGQPQPFIRTMFIRRGYSIQDCV